MPRLPAQPDIEWKPDGTPVATRHGDVYFTAGDGLAETRTVFLRGNGLPERWAGRDRFVVAETGFGTGLNLLALWALWRAHRPAPAAWLHVVSFEAFPMRRADAEQALSQWPELAPLAAQLLEQWPHSARGVRHLTWAEDGISLTLHVGDIAETLPVAVFDADAWMLDGFSPARNADMWAETLYPLIAERSAPGATAATFTVAGTVRRGLAAAGFEVAKKPGHGRKRERLEAGLSRVVPVAGPASGPPADPAPGRRVAIIGAGIMGACLAHTLAALGADVSVFDRGAGPARGASGNALALVMPRLDAADTVQARLLVDAYLAARMAYAGKPGVTETEVRQSPRDAAERRRFEKVLADPPLPLEDLEALSDGGLLHKRALIIEPPVLIPALLGDVETRFGADPDIDLANRQVNGAAFDAIVLANSMVAAACAPWLGLVGKLGQVEHVSGLAEAPASAVAAGHYALAMGDQRLWGATFEAAESDAAPVTERARAANRTALEALAPWWLAQMRDRARAEMRERAAVSRASIRATTADRLPLAGPLPDVAAIERDFAPLAKGQAATGPAVRVPGVWVATGLGSRGFTFAPWLAGALSARMLGAPWPIPRDTEAAIDPLRVLVRRIKRGG
ncbi:MAG: tRNA (5-methylaminomethyl-2-thiouridine)(34)-methyltransferase MnmD [Pseudomonadota bacterium]